jgi:hypothetical protein
MTKLVRTKENANLERRAEDVPLNKKHKEREDMSLANK